jgi:hypothetical protein
MRRSEIRSPGRSALPSFISLALWTCPWPVIRVTAEGKGSDSPGSSFPVSRSDPPLAPKSAPMHVRALSAGRVRASAVTLFMAVRASIRPHMLYLCHE